MFAASITLRPVDILSFRTSSLSFRRVPRIPCTPVFESATALRNPSAASSAVPPVPTRSAMRSFDFVEPTNRLSSDLPLRFAIMLLSPVIVWLGSRFTQSPSPYSPPFNFLFERFCPFKTLRAFADFVGESFLYRRLPDRAPRRLARDLSPLGFPS